MKESVRKNQLVGVRHLQNSPEKQRKTETYEKNICDMKQIIISLKDETINYSMEVS